MLVATVLAAGLLVGCGGDDDDSAKGTPLPATTTFAVADLIPDMTRWGFKPVTEGLPPGFADSPTSKVVLFQNPAGKVSSIRLELSVVPTQDAAATKFNTLAEALKNPPPDLFGGSAVQTAGTPVYQADQSRSFQTDKPDKEGTLVFSDIHRFGLAIVIQYTIGPDTAETAKVRKEVAEAIAEKAPR